MNDEVIQVSDSGAEQNMVPVFSAMNTTGEMEALGVQGVLESVGIPAVMIGTTTLPSLEFVVQVPADRLEEAKRAIAEAQQAGPAAALEAEAQSEALGQTPDQN